MRFATIVLIAVLGSVSAAAQAVHTKPAGSGGTVAGMAPAPAVVDPTLVPPPGTFLYGNVPIVVSPDGRVFADFGRGYEQIVRGCSVPVNYGAASSPAVGQPTVVQPTVVQQNIGTSQPLPYTPPVPNQQTPSQQMLSQATGQMPAGQSGVINAQACWSTNGRGQVYVSRP